MEWIIDDGNRASEVIRRVRTLAKKTILAKLPLDINDVVKETMLLVRRELISHQVSLQSARQRGGFRRRREERGLLCHLT